MLLLDWIENDDVVSLKYDKEIWISRTRIDWLLEWDIRKMIIWLIDDNRSKLLPRIAKLPEFDVKTTFYFSEDEKKYIIFSPSSNNSISLSNISMPWDWVKWMLFSIYHALKLNKNALLWSVIPLKKISPNLIRRKEILCDFYRSFEASISQIGSEELDFSKDIKMKIDLKNSETLYNLYLKISNYLEKWNW